MEAGERLMKAKFLLALATVVGIAHSVPVLAHHSFAAEFDADSPIELTGIVTKVEWMNPRTWGLGRTAGTRVHTATETRAGLFCSYSTSHFSQWRLEND